MSLSQILNRSIRNILYIIIQEEAQHFFIPKAISSYSGRGQTKLSSNLPRMKWIAGLWLGRKEKKCGKIVKGKEKKSYR